MDATLRLLRILQAAMLASVVLYAVAGELAGPKEPKDLKQVQMMLTVLAAGFVAAILILRQRMLPPAEDTLRSQPEDIAALVRWRVGHMTTFVLPKPSRSMAWCCG